jgi:iron complex transport system substrate-binding protein
MHQEPFADVDLSEKADEIYTFLVGAPVHEHMVKNYGPLGSKAPFIQENRR